jgi:delta 1-pyrroline-5-carboxylate dehydrogenase
MPHSGPVISPTAKNRILDLIASAEQEGGKIHLDGRPIKVSGYEHGNFIGPTVIEADTTMKCYEYVVSSTLSYLSRSMASLVKRFSGPSLSLSRPTR